MKDYVIKNIRESIEAKELLLSDNEIIELICDIVSACVEAYKSGHKILVCGNGGSASDAQHMVGELVGRFKIERMGIPAISLNSNVVVMTAVCNDYDYDSIFEKQLSALGYEGDILFAITTSGNSNNCIKAVKLAKEKGITSVGLTGLLGGAISDYCDYVVKAPSTNTPRIQEMHILIIHLICGLIEKELFGMDGHSNE